MAVAIHTAASCHSPRKAIDQSVCWSLRQCCSNRPTRWTAWRFHRGSSTDSHRSSCVRHWCSSIQPANLTKPQARPSQLLISVNLTPTHLADRLPRSRGGPAASGVVAGSRGFARRAAGGAVILVTTARGRPLRRRAAVVASRALLTSSHGGVGALSQRALLTFAA